jgi:hypothetical protein
MRFHRSLAGPDHGGLADYHRRLTIERPLAHLCQNGLRIRFEIGSALLQLTCWPRRPRRRCPLLSTQPMPLSESRFSPACCSRHSWTLISWPLRAFSIASTQGNARTAPAWPSSPLRSKLIWSSCRPVLRKRAEVTYGVPPEQVIGSSGKLKFEMRDDQPVLSKLPEIELVNDNVEKPVPSRNLLAAVRSRRSVIPTVTLRCCNGRPQGRVLASRYSSTTTTQFENLPTIAPRPSGNSTRHSMKQMRRVGQSSI